MRRYRWPGYEMKLLGELQKQQNNAQFCDTLLQTEGISVPTHSCILAALSPYLSQKLSASSSPPMGQKRQLHLQAVKAQTLLKLVSLLYSGELEVKGSVEQEDVLSAAQQFGITDLVEGQGSGKRGEPQENNCREKESRRLHDAQVQADDVDSPGEKRSCVSTGTQTVKAGEKIAGCSFTQSTQTKHPTPGPAPSVAQRLDFVLQSQNITLDKHFRSTSCPHIPSKDSGAQSDRGSTSDTTSALSSNMTTVPVSLIADSNFTTPQEDGAHQQSSEGGDSVQVLAKEGLEDGKTADDRGNPEQPSHRSRDEMMREDKGNSAEKRHAHVGSKSLAKMKKQMMETAQISIKVKLKRRPEGEAWEVVSRRDTDLTVLTQDCSNHKRPQADLTVSEPPPSSTPILPPAAATISTEPPPPPNTSSDSQLLSTDCFAPHQNILESAPLPQSTGPAEECDEQIEKLLEDIMMGLNILPNVERDCKKSHYLPPNQDGATAICQVPATESERPQCRAQAAVSAAGCVHYQDSGTQIGHSSSDTAQNQPNCSSLSSVQPTAVLIQQQQQQRRFPQFPPPVTSMVQREGTSHQGMPLSKSQSCPYPEAPTTRSVIPAALYSSGQKRFTALTYYPACQEPASQGNPNILEFLPLTNRNEAQSSHSLTCMDDLRLPPCLSPLDPPTLNNSMNQSSKIQPQPSLHRRPWLTVNPRSLQFPLSAITPKANTSVSLPQYTKHSCWSTQWQKHLELNPQNWGTRAASCTVKEVEDRGATSAGHHDEAEPKSDPRKPKESLIEVEDRSAICAGLPNVAEQEPAPRKMKESLKCKQGVTKGDAVAPKRRKRKRTSQTQEASSLLAFKCVKVSDGTKGQINLSVCSVSLSSNNVLAKERGMTAGTSTAPNKDVEKPNEPSTITENLGEKTRESGCLKTDQRTRIRTRGFMKKTQETASNSSMEDSALKPMVFKAQIVNKGGKLPKRGRGRPRETKVVKSPPQSSPAVIEKDSQDVNREAQTDSGLPKEASEKTKRKSKKRRRNRSEVEAIPLKESRRAESTVEAAADDDVIPAGRKVGTPKRPQMVNLKEFQKLLKRRHSKARRSKEGQDKETTGTSRDVGSEGTVMDVAQPQNKDGTEESHVLFGGAVDENHNEIFHKSTAEFGESQRGDSNSCKETSLLGDESHPVLAFDVLGEEVESAAGREQPVKSPHEALKASDAGVPDAEQTAFNDEGSSHGDTPPAQRDKTPLNHNMNPQTPERTAPPLTDGFSESSEEKEEEEEEEEEVDVLLYSPDKVPQNRECDNIMITPEEEEEEDGNEVDVTGDEAE